jgi:hypothetical protein
VDPHQDDGPISGFVGLVLVPDGATIAAAYELAQAALPAGAESALGPGALPHVTLTQCALRDAPRTRIAGIIERLDTRLRGRSIPLGVVIPTGGGFVFWCVDETAPERQLLQQAHEDALGLADGFLDPVANAAVVEGTMRLTGNDPVLVRHAHAHGYAFVGDRFMPHVTLGFDPRLAVEARGGPALAILERRHLMHVERVALARLGRYGRVGALVSC